jgi:hypothetical protein
MKRTRLKRGRKWKSLGQRRLFIGRLGPSAARTEPSHCSPGINIRLQLTYSKTIIFF